MPVKSNRVVLFAAVAGTLALTACGGSTGSSAGDSSSKAPIVLGSIASLSGQGVFPDPGKAAQAVFDDVNAAGGINGRKIEFKIVDDAGDPAKSAQAARRLVEQDKAIGMVASASAFDCFNGSYYARNKIDAVVSVAILPPCFNSANIAATTGGPFTGVSVSLLYAAQTLHKTALCVISPKANGFQQGTEGAVQRFEQASGQKIKLAQYIPQVTDYQPYILKAKQGGCDAIVVLTPSNLAVAYEKQFNQAGARATITSIQLSSGYSVETAKALEGVADGMYVNAEFLPFTGSGADDPGLDAWKKTMTAHDLPLNAFGQGGYLAAQIMVDVMKGIKGDITRDSLSAALVNMQPYTNSLLGNPWIFGKGTSHDANRSSRFVQLKKGVWEPVTTQWVTLPAA